MRLTQVMVFLVLLVPMTVSVWAGQQLDVDDGSQVTITSPQNGQTVGTAFELVYALKKGTMADHVHVFLDDTYQKGFEGQFTNVPTGRHTITVKVATHDHDMVAVSDTIDVVVQ
ncbi:MAG: hypothetical protein NPIRA01_38540 [Nitrospirales bacterium]|nr:MAG: hypothetical protein NPIRA01_38540 [Nitrospirales bacterium]